jgi:hypothetical protein
MRCHKQNGARQEGGGSAAGQLRGPLAAPPPGLLVVGGSRRLHGWQGGKEHKTNKCMWVRVRW